MSRSVVYDAFVRGDRKVSFLSSSTSGRMATPHEEPKGRPIRCMLSRRRYDALARRLADEGFAADAVESFLAALRDVMNFDPTETTAACSERHLKYVHRKAAELGTTTYVTSGRKAMYERRRTEGP